MMYYYSNCRRRASRARRVRIISFAAGCSLMCIFGPMLAKGQPRAPYYLVNFQPAEVYPLPAGNDVPYGLAIADVVGPPPDYLPDGLPDVAIAISVTTDTPGFSGRVIIFRNTGVWDGTASGLVFFSQINFPIFSHPGQLDFHRPPYDLRWVDIDRDPPRYDLDLVVTTSANIQQGSQQLTPPAGLWVIRNNCTTDPAGRFDLLFDQGVNWPYPIDFEGWHFPGLDVDELTGDTLPDVACGGLDARPGSPTLDKAAVQVFANLGGLNLAEETVWSDAGMPQAFGSAVVSRRTRFDPATRPEADVMMSLVPEGGVDKTLVLHPDGAGGFVSSAPVGIHGYGLALQEFRPCELGLVSTFWDGGVAKARVMFLDTNGNVIPGFDDYELPYAPFTPANAWGVATGRFDLNGLWDFAVAFGVGGPALHGGGGVAVFWNNPVNPGNFLGPKYFDSDPTAVSPGAGPTFVVTADMDNDRRADLVVTNTRSNTIGVLINAN